MKVYDKERRHPAPSDVVAQALGYKGAANGAAAATLASLRYYGLIERPKDGFLAASKDLEAFKFAPTEEVRRALIHKWLKTPQIFSDMLAQYGEHLPSDANIRYDLIQRGFMPAAAENFVGVFRRSVEYAGPVHMTGAPQTQPEESAEDTSSEVIQPSPEAQQRSDKASSELNRGQTAAIDLREDVVRVPIRLPQGRFAWLELPVPFFEADKERIKAHIDLQLTDDE
ncbi:hypothetical protein ACS7SF_09630 [Ralstonia sp. 25C]|uniref:hypothetical protein n=1 Tax=Ralstonia sp. 25C TaxID=3447363 RepID=UPI003F74E1C6